MVQSIARKERSQRREKRHRKPSPVSRRITSFTTMKGTQVHVTNQEPIADYAHAIQREKNRQASNPTPSSEERLREIEEELSFRDKIQRLNALEIGRLYYEARGILLGRFRTWITEFGLHKKTAVYDYINVYKFCLGCPELVEAIPPTKLQIICSPNFPEDFRESIFKNGSVSGTNTELVKTAGRVRSGELKMESPEVQRHLRDLEFKEIEKTMREILDNLKGNIAEAKKEIEKLLPKKKDPTHEKGITPVIERLVEKFEGWENELLSG